MSSKQLQNAVPLFRSYSQVVLNKLVPHRASAVLPNAFPFSSDIFIQSDISQTVENPSYSYFINCTLYSQPKRSGYFLVYF